MVGTSKYFGDDHGAVRCAVRAVLLCVVTLILGFQSGLSHAAEVVLVMSGEAPYQQAGSALSGELKSLGHTVKSLRLVDARKATSAGSLQALRELGLVEADVFVGVGTESAVWTKNTLDSVRPVVYCMVVDPEGAGLTGASNVFGMGTNVPLADQFHLIRQVLPGTKTVGLLYREEDPGSDRLLRDLERELPAGWRLEAIGVSGSRTASRGITELLRRDVDIVWTQPDASIYDQAAVRALLLSALRKKVPVFGFSVSFVRAGALVGIGVSPEMLGLQAAQLTDHLIDEKFTHKEGWKHKFEFAVNRTAAERLGVELPSEIVGRAAYVFGWEKR